MITINGINNSIIQEHLKPPPKIIKIKKKHKPHKKIGNICYCLNLLEQFGPINIISFPDSSKFFLSKIELVQFNDHFDELLEKGKLLHKKQYSSDNSQSIPDMSFWSQRYYYYSLFDKGILMDEESNLILLK